MRCASFRSLVATHEIRETGGTRLATALPRRLSRRSLHGRCAPCAGIGRCRRAYASPSSAWTGVAAIVTARATHGPCGSPPFGAPTHGSAARDASGPGTFPVQTH
ncbi:conserved hypothetical protein [Burkholderia multivorans CGD1]|nr:conserved hypothetical protein [Burkholderia multivorans CGD1]